MNSPTYTYGNGSKQILSGTPSVVSFAKVLSTKYSTALSESIEQATKEETEGLRESARLNTNGWAQLADSVEVWHDPKKDLIHYGVRTSADDIELTRKLEYGADAASPPSPLLRSSAKSHKDTFAKRVSQLLDRKLSKALK